MRINRHYKQTDLTQHFNFMFGRRRGYSSALLGTTSPCSYANIVNASSPITVTALTSCIHATHPSEQPAGPRC